MRFLAGAAWSVLAPSPTPSPGGGGGPTIPDYGGSGASTCLSRNETFCWSWVQQNKSYVIDSLEKHVKLTVIAIVVGFAISLVLALLAYRLRWLTLPINFLSSLLYTIPSLAAFYILVQITGLEDLTAEIALVSYTLLILFTNTLAGLNGVGDEVRDAARGVGLSRAQMLWRVELPLAVPTIIAGIRIATVTTISLVTVAGLIGLGALGDVIYVTGVKGQTNSALIVGGVLCIALALLADGLLVLLQRLITPWATARRGV